MQSRVRIAMVLAAAASGCAALLDLDPPDYHEAVAFDGGDSGPPTSDAAPPDAGPEVAPEPACSRRPFTNVVELVELNSDGIDNSPTLSPDELTIFFHSNRGTATELYTATRATAVTAFGIAVKLTFGMPSYPAQYPSLAPNALELVFEREIAPGDNDVFKAFRPSTSAPFGPPAVIAQLSTGNYDGFPQVRDDGSIYFASNRDGGVSDIYLARKIAGGFDVAAVPSLNTAADHEIRPVLSSTGREAFFASNAGAGSGWKLWTAFRDDPNGAFGPAMQLALPGVNDILPSWLSPDGCRLYLAARKIADASRENDVWVAIR